MSTPEFYIIGAPKCGTGTVRDWLSQHPRAFFPSNPLPFFHATDLAEHYPHRTFYQRSYEAARKDQIRGETCPWYLFSEDAVDSILSDRPDAKFVVCLRDPADMAWTLHAAQAAEGREDQLDFGAAWDMSQLRAKGSGPRHCIEPRTLDYASVCAMGSQLVRLMSKVPADRLHVVFYQDIEVAPDEVFFQLLHFLDLPDMDLEHYPIEEFVIARHVKSLHVFMRRALDTRNAVLPQRLVNLGFQKLMGRINGKAGNLPAMPDHFRQMVSDTLSEDIGLISGITGRDLQDWLA
jgi:hypothetical protein